MNRDHESSIKALRAAALKIVKDIEQPGMHSLWTSHCRLDAAAMTRAAEYLASITGPIERSQKRARKAWLK